MTLERDFREAVARHQDVSLDLRLKSIVVRDNTPSGIACSLEERLRRRFATPPHLRRLVVNRIGVEQNVTPWISREAVGADLAQVENAARLDITEQHGHC